MDSIFVYGYFSALGAVVVWGAIHWKLGVCKKAIENYETRICETERDIREAYEQIGKEYVGVRNAVWLAGRIAQDGNCLVSYMAKRARKRMTREEFGTAMTLLTTSGIVGLYDRNKRMYWRKYLRKGKRS